MGSVHKFQRRLDSETRSEVFRLAVERKTSENTTKNITKRSLREIKDSLGTSFKRNVSFLDPINQFTL